MLNLRDKVHNVTGRLYQARMWREYVLAFDGKPNRSGVTREWLEKVGKYTRECCLRRYRLNLLLARRLNQREARHCFCCVHNTARRTHEELIARCWLQTPCDVAAKARRMTAPAAPNVASIDPAPII